MSTASKWYENAKAAAVIHRTEGKSVRQSAAALIVTPAFVKYHEKKALDPEFHAGTHGGPRNTKFTTERQLEVEVMLWALVKQNPVQLPKQFAAELHLRGADVNPKYGSLWLHLSRCCGADPSLYVLLPAGGSLGSSSGGATATRSSKRAL